MIPPILFLSGSYPPIEATPPWMEALGHLAPLKYYLNLGFGIFIKGVPVTTLWDRPLGLALMGGAIFVLGAFRFWRAFA